MPTRLLLLLVLLAPTAVQAQMPRPALDHVAWQAAVGVSAAGDTVVAVHATIGEGWKLYALDTPPPSPPLLLSAVAPPGVTVGTFAQQTPRSEPDPILGVTVRLFREEAVFQAPISGGGPGMEPVEVALRFTICDKSICLPPTPHTLQAAWQGTDVQAWLKNLDASPTAGMPATSGAVPDFTRGDAALPDQTPTAGEEEVIATPAAVPAAQADAGGMSGFLLLALISGLGALLMPCVFPMIPLTVSYFTRHSHSRGEAVRMSLFYGLSIVGTFTGLGVLMALLLGATGAQQVAANPYVNLFIGVAFVVFALSLLGLFELELPNALVNRFSREERRGGLVGVAFMGFTLTLVSFSCTVPFVGGLLAATVQGTWFQPIVGMLVFSVTFALPFVLFALFPRALQSLPRSGAWMNAFKVTLGFVELAAALKFLSQADLLWGWGIFTRPVTIAASVVLFALCGLYLLGKLPLRNVELAPQMGVGRLLTAVLFFGVSLYLLPGLFGASLGTFDAYLPPRRATDFTLNAASATAPQPAEAWHEGVQGLADARAEARQTGKPLFIDFTGYTCSNCRFMESTVFTQPEVQTRFTRDFVLARLYTDDLEEGETLSRYQLEQTGTVALPTYAILDVQAGTLVAQHSGVASLETFVAFLDQGAGAASPAVVREGVEQDGALAVFQHR